jgi:hypothetical protein
MEQSEQKCSFCNKGGKLISGPSHLPRAYICAECVMVCVAILEDDRPAAESPEILAAEVESTTASQY